MMRNHRYQSHVSRNYHDVIAVTDKLTREILSLKNKLEDIKSTPSYSNLSIAQTYKEMIHGRKTLVKDLTKSNGYVSLAQYHRLQ